MLLKGIKRMDIFMILNMIGGLALFLYGMKTMGDALSKLARQIRTDT